MSPQLEPRVLGLTGDASASARLRDLSPDTTDPEVLDRLAVWLAEVSAEAARRRPIGEAEPPAARPTI